MLGRKIDMRSREGGEKVPGKKSPGLGSRMTTTEALQGDSCLPVETRPEPPKAGANAGAIDQNQEPPKPPLIIILLK